jgi:hypothetical protein
VEGEVLARVFAWLPAVVLAALPCVSSAQETTGRLEGRVLDAKGAPIAEVNVTVTSPALQGGRGCLTSARGTFVLLALPVGEYRVKLAHLAYQAQVFEAVRVRLGQTATLGDVRLADAVLEQPEIVVKAGRPLIDPRSTETGGVLSNRDYSALPIERDYRSAMVLLPQANLSYLGDAVNIAGFTGLDNRFFMDGMEASEPLYGATATSLPYNFVQEVELRTGGYMPEYRSALGGIVNAVTYSGGNELKAQAFSFYTRNRPTADPRYAFKPNTGDYALYDIGAGLGGPIRRDRLWYYVAYNPTFIREDIDIPGLGYHEDRTTVHSFAGKLTWRASTRNTFVMTALGDPTSRKAVAASFGNFGAPVTVANPDVLLTDIGTGSIGVAIEGRSTLRDELVLKSSFSLARFTDRNVPSTERGRDEVLFVDDESGTWSGGGGSSVNNRSLLSHVGLTATWFTGTHEVKTGLEYKQVRTRYDLTFDIIDRRPDATFGRAFVTYKFVVGNRIPSAFLQDSWRLTDRLRLNGGVRWDGQILVGSDGEVAQRILGQWQPRAGFIWTPGGPGAQKLFASVGRFFHDLNTWGVQDFGDYYQAFLSYDHDPRLDPSGGSGIEVRNVIPAEVHGMEGQYVDELTGGYERQVSSGGRLGIEANYRVQRQGLEGGMNPVTGEYQFNNPGSGKLSDFPRMKHEYTALVLSWQQRASDQLSLLASYVLSRSRGNYPGLYASDVGYVAPNGAQFDQVENLVNAYGLLPNDRTHVLKLSASYRAGAGVTLGMLTGWQSGTPLSEFARLPGIISPVFVRQRGTVGRTPSTWDLSLRVAYQPLLPGAGQLRPRVTADFMHIGSERKAVTYDQLHYWTGSADWSFSDPSATYLRPTQYQPAPSVRVGAEVAF